MDRNNCEEGKIILKNNEVEYSFSQVKNVGDWNGRKSVQIKRTRACTSVQTEYKKGCTFSLLDCTAEALPYRLRSALAYMKFVLKRFQHQTDAKIKSALNEEDGTE